MVTNMVAELDGSAALAEDESGIVARAGISLVQHNGTTHEERAWLRRHFSPMWEREASASWNWFAKDAAGNTVGFASYEQRRYRFWWLSRWLKQPDVGIFGPMGVEESMRGKRLGCVLARRALASIREMGYRRAVIPRVGPIEFYERCCGARVVERVKFLGLF